MSSNFIVFPFRAVPGLFCSSLERQRTKQAGNVAKGRTEAGGGWQGARAARCVTNTIYRLARHRRISPSDRPSRAERRTPGGGRSGQKRHSLDQPASGCVVRKSAHGMHTGGQKTSGLGCLLAYRQSVEKGP